MPRPKSGRTKRPGPSALIGPPHRWIRVQFRLRCRTPLKRHVAGGHVRFPEPLGFVHRASWSAKPTMPAATRVDGYFLRLAPIAAMPTANSVSPTHFK